MNSHESLGLKEVSNKQKQYNSSYHHKLHSSSTTFKVRARSLRKKEASKKQIEMQKALATATTPGVAAVKDESKALDATPGFAIPGAPTANAQSSISTGSSVTAVAKKKVYSLKIEDNIESKEAELRLVHFRGAR